MVHHPVCQWDSASSRQRILHGCMMGTAEQFILHIMLARPTCRITKAVVNLLPDLFSEVKMHWRPVLTPGPAAHKHVLAYDT